MFHNWFSSARSRSKGQKRKPQRSSFRPGVESLEGRWVPAGVLEVFQFGTCNPTTHRGGRKAFRPPPHPLPEWLREPTAAAGLGVG